MLIAVISLELCHVLHVLKEFRLCCSKVQDGCTFRYRLNQVDLVVTLT